MCFIHQSRLSRLILNIKKTYKASIIILLIMLDKSFIFYTHSIEAKSETVKGVKRYYVKGHIDSEKIDLVNDIVTKACMDDVSVQFKNRNLKLDFNHETLIGDTELEGRIALTKIPLGKALEQTQDAKGNFVKFELNPNWKKFDSKGTITMTFAEIWANIKSKMYDAFSIAYIPINTTDKIMSGKTVRMLDKINLINVALTGNPINPDATLTSVMAKSLAYLKSKEDKENSYKKKSFDKDGAHAHTDESPIGEHNHAEIERIMNERLDYVHERINNLSRPETSKDDDSLMIGKSNNGDIMTEEEDKKKQTKSGEEESGDTGNSNDNDDSSTNTQEFNTEGEALDTKIVEIKSILEKTTEKIDALVESNKALQAKSKEFETILAKARPAAKGAESKDAQAEANTKSDVKTSGPLDII